MKHLLKSTTAALAVATLALTAGAASAQDYSAYEGTTLVVNFPAHPHYEAVQKVLPQFTEETGIEVEVDELQYLRMRDAQLLEMSKPEGDYDLISYVVFWKTEYADKRLVEPLAYYVLDPTLNMPDYEPEDLIPGYVQNIGQVGGAKGYLPGPISMTIGVPFGAETSVLGYRKDIFEKHGLEVPETYDELMALACQIPELEPGMAGLASRGQSNHQAVHAWLLHLAPQGGAVFDENWKPVVNNEDRRQGGRAAQDDPGMRPRGRHLLRLRRGVQRVPPGQRGDVSRFDLDRCGGRGPGAFRDRRPGRLGAAPDGHRARLANRWLRHRHPVQQPQQGGGLPPDAVADVQEGRQAYRHGRRLAIALLDL